MKPNINKRLKSLLSQRVKPFTKAGNKAVNEIVKAFKKETDIELRLHEKDEKTINIMGVNLQIEDIRYAIVNSRDLKSKLDKELRKYYDKGRWYKFDLKYSDFNDGSYAVLDKYSCSIVTDIIYKVVREVLKIEYKTKIFDCENFAELAKIIFTLVLYYSGVSDAGAGIALIKYNYNNGANGHSINLIPIVDDDIIISFYEPQSWKYPISLSAFKKEYSDFLLYGIEF